MPCLYDRRVNVVENVISPQTDLQVQWNPDRFYNIFMQNLNIPRDLLKSKSQEQPRNPLRRKTEGLTLKLIIKTSIILVQIQKTKATEQTQEHLHVYKFLMYDRFTADQ